ncbi:hypothetical protein Bca4012_018756 [Brassica carinata]
MWIFFVALKPGESRIWVGDIPPTPVSPIGSAALSVSLTLGLEVTDATLDISDPPLPRCYDITIGGYLYGQLIRLAFAMLKTYSISDAETGRRCHSFKNIAMLKTYNISDAGTGRRYRSFKNARDSKLFMIGSKIVRWIPMQWRRPLSSTTTLPPTTTVSVSAVSTRKLPCPPSRVIRSKESRASSPSSPLSLFQQFKHNISTVDCQPSGPASCMLVFVSGNLQLASEEHALK